MANGGVATTPNGDKIKTWVAPVVQTVMGIVLIAFGATAIQSRTDIAVMQGNSYTVKDHVTHLSERALLDAMIVDKMNVMQVTLSRIDERLGALIKNSDKGN